MWRDIYIYMHIKWFHPFFDVTHYSRISKCKYKPLVIFHSIYMLVFIFRSDFKDPLMSDVKNNNVGQNLRNIFAKFKKYFIGANLKILWCTWNYGDLSIDQNSTLSNYLVLLQQSITTLLYEFIEKSDDKYRVNKNKLTSLTIRINLHLEPILY